MSTMSHEVTSPGIPPPGPTSRGGVMDKAFRIVTVGGALLVMVVVAAIVVTLVTGAAHAFATFGPGFVWSRAWNPVAEQFGALPSLLGTVVSAVLALAIAIPLAIGIATFLTELAPTWLARPVAIAVEMLAAIPSIIYGMWGLFVLAPILSIHVQPLLSKYLGWLPLFRGPTMGIGMMTAALVLSLMVVPYVAAVARDLFTMVPVPVKEAAAGLGATRWEVVSSIVLPYTRSGLMGAVMLGLGRALGETMAVTFVIGNSHQISASLYKPSNTIASTLANEFAEATSEVHLSALMALALCLFVLTLLTLALGRVLVRRAGKREGRA